MSKPTEHKTVRARILEYAEAIGWTFVLQKEGGRRDIGNLRFEIGEGKKRTGIDLNRRDRSEDLERSIWPHAAAKFPGRQLWHRLCHNLATACRQILEQAVQERKPATEIP